MLLACGLACGLIFWRVRADAYHERLNLTLARELKRSSECDLREVSKLILLGAGPDTQEDYKQPTESLVARMKRFLLRRATPPKGRGKTPLMFASAFKDLILVRELVKRGADINASTEDGETALLMAVSDADDYIFFDTPSKFKATPASSTEIIRVLLNAKANTNGAMDWAGCTPYTKSICLKDDDIDRLFLQHGAKWNIKNRFGITGFWVAVDFGRTELVRRVLAEGANPNETEIRHGETVLMRAVSDNHIEVARLLLDAGAKVNIPYRTARSNLLNYAIHGSGSEKMVKMLLDRGADPNVKDVSGKNVWYWARELHNQPVLRLLEAHGKKHTADHGKP